jgi:nitroimidazol reductase NimA-like FMN-containing flavoprotein (pyridoxamine 5'-phosphate oxidase superfamily)
MRRSATIDELHPDEIESVLSWHHVRQLACVTAGEPYLAPIAYADQGGSSYGHTLPGQKLNAMRDEPRVAFA